MMKMAVVASTEEGRGRTIIRPRGRPGWLEGLMGPERGFFEGCGDHQDRRKNEKNVFCLRCCRSLCPHCLPAHPSHPLLQVRRYVYHDVIRLGDLEKLLDCSYIQPYTINGAKVIFLNERPQSRSCKGSANICFNCDRILQEPFHFCSLHCKVDHLMYQGEELSEILRRFDESDFSISQFEGLRMDGTLMDQFGDEDEAEADQGRREMMINNNTATAATQYYCSMGNNNILVEEDIINVHRAAGRLEHVKSSSSNIIIYPAETTSGQMNNNNIAGMAKRNKKKGSGTSGSTGSGFFSRAHIVATTSSQLAAGSRRKGAPHRAPFT